MRWWKFNAVGALGWVVQTAVLTGLFHGAGVHYLLATLLAVEAAVLHNFFWHRRWTWADRRGHQSVASALLRFNLSNGLVSIVGNLLFMRLLVGGLKLEPVFANWAAIALCAALNYLLSDRFAFLAGEAPERRVGRVNHSFPSGWRCRVSAGKESGRAAGIA